MMALSGVRSSWLILARNLRLGLVGFLGAVLFLGIFLGEVGELEGLALQRGLRAFQVDHRGAQAQVVVDQLLFVLLDAGDVGADRDIAAVLGAPLADMQPAAVLDLGLEGARARRRRAALVQPGADLRHAADLDHGLVGCAGDHRGIRQLVQALEVRVAQHQAIFRVPQHEGFRNGLDRVAQPKIGLDGLFGEALLLGDVDRDADQVQAGVAGGRGSARSAPAARSSGRRCAACERSGRCDRSCRRSAGRRSRTGRCRRTSPAR